MYVLLWRYNARSPWYVHNKPMGSEQDVRTEINSMVRYDVGGRREYRWAPIGDVSTWHDPFAEQAENERLHAEADWNGETAHALDIDKQMREGFK